MFVSVRCVLNSKWHRMFELNLFQFLYAVIIIIIITIIMIVTISSSSH